MQQLPKWPPVAALLVPPDALMLPPSATINKLNGNLMYDAGDTAQDDRFAAAFNHSNHSFIPLSICPFLHLLRCYRHEMVTALFAFVVVACLCWFLFLNVPEVLSCVRLVLCKYTYICAYICYITYWMLSYRSLSRLKPAHAVRNANRYIDKGHIPITVCVKLLSVYAGLSYQTQHIYPHKYVLYKQLHIAVCSWNTVFYSSNWIVNSINIFIRSVRVFI